MRLASTFMVYYAIIRAYIQILGGLTYDTYKKW